MQAPADFYTVFRSQDASAEQDCQLLLEDLTAAGLHPVLLNDQAPGVPVGVFEVRVPAAEALRAEEITREDEAAVAEPGDDSAALDLEPIAQVSEVEALGIRSLLESSGITTVLVGDSVLPNIPFEVRVAREQADRARNLVAEAEKNGPAAAAEAEAEGEAAQMYRPPQ